MEHQLLGLATVIVGLIIAAARAFQAFRLAIHVDAFSAVLEKCLRMGDLSRSRKICQSAPEAPVAVATRAMLDVPAFPIGASHEDARATLLDAFIRAFEEKTAPLVASRFVAWVAPLLLVGPVVHAYLSSALAAPLVVVSAAGIAALAWTARSARKTIASGPRVVDRLLPHTLPLLFASSYRAPEPVVVPDDALQPNTLVLVVTRVGEEPRTLTFNQPIIKIGRAKNSHVQLDDDAVGRIHAVIERGDDGATVIDLGNASGTVVNGERVNKAKLAHDDVLEFGPFRLKVGIGNVARN